MEHGGGDRGKQSMVGDSSNRRGNSVFEARKFHPIAIVAIVEALGVADQGEGKKKNPDHHRIGLVHWRATINAIIHYEWMKWFVLNVEEKKNYRD
ncbi:hypothetical protein R1flu_026762 [Riccia fluitans]|uniref:Uncharacterized protein n=1 Tax=Riccia fluitans TaxID=41844 RepID=A0ABD1XHH1_9MARC